jgi:arsenate reductase
VEGIRSRIHGRVQGVGSSMKKKPSILFLSKNNAVRGQMAEAMLRHLAGDRFEVTSAGIDPQPVPALTQRVLEEAGIEAAPLTSKNVRDFMARTVVNVAIMLSDDTPADPRVYPFAPFNVTWRFEDPLSAPGTEEEMLGRFRRLRDSLRERLQGWLVEQAAREAVLQETALV